MIHYIANEADLAKAVAIRQPGDLFKGTELFHVEGNYQVSEVTFHDMEVILRQRKYQKVEGIVPFLEAQACTFVRCRVNGVMPTTTTTWQEDGLQFGVKATDCQLYDCRVEDVNYIGFMLDRSDVTGGEFNNCATPKEGYGFGHPLWVRGDGIIEIKGASFSNNRHCIASSFELSGIIAFNCEFSCGQYSKHILDRHGEGGNGGMWFVVNDCIFNNPNNYAYDFARHKSGVEFINCTFARPFGKNGRIGGVVESENLATYKNNIYKS